MSKIIEQIEQQQVRKIPDFNVGDTVEVHVRVKEEGARERIQKFEGVVLAKRNRGFNSSCTVRKISSGVGVERVFPLHSPLVKEIVLKRRGDVRLSKLYYMRDLYGKAARIKEKLVSKNKTNNVAVENEPADDLAAMPDNLDAGNE